MRSRRVAARPIRDKEPETLARARTARLAVGTAWSAAKLDVCLLGALRVLAGVIPAATTYLLSVLFRQAAEHRLNLATIAGLLTGLLAGAIVPPVSHYVLLRISRTCAISSRAELYRVLARFPTLEAVEGSQRQDEVRLAIDAAAQSPILTLDGSMALVQGLLAVGSIFWLVFVTNALVAVIATALALPIAALRLRAAALRTSARILATPFERRSMFYEQLLTNLDHARELRTLQLFGLFRDRMVHQLRQAQKPIRLADRRELIVELALGGLSACIVGVAVMMLRTASVEVLTIVVVGIPQLISQLETTFNSASTVRTALQLFGSYVRLSDRAAEASQPASRELAPLTEGITFKDVWFRYPESTGWALRGISLYLPAGQSSGIVGRNGAGKSTIAALICGLYRPTSGQILWDGQDLAGIEVTDLRQRINIAFQRATQYEMTVAENIWLGDISKVATAAEIADCLRRVSLLDRIEAMPSASNTMLSKTFSAEADPEHAGSLLSGGEWQRLVLARLHFRWPRDLTILDEPTANLDPISERNAHQAMRTLLRGKTAVTIAHRLQLVTDSDQILVMDEGQVVQVGRHAELIEQSGLYRQLCEAQRGPVTDSSPVRG